MLHILLYIIFSISRLGKRNIWYMMRTFPQSVASVRKVQCGHPKPKRAPVQYCWSTTTMDSTILLSLHNLSVSSVYMLMSMYIRKVHVLNTPLPLAAVVICWSLCGKRLPRCCLVLFINIFAPACWQNCSESVSRLFEDSRHSESPSRN